MIVLDTTGDTIQAEASAGSSVTITAYGVESSTSESYKKLGQAQIASGSKTTVYTVPSSTVTVCSTLVAVNTSSSSVTLTVYHVPNGGSAGDSNTLFSEISLDAGATLVWNKGDISIVPENGVINASEVEALAIGSPTYHTVQDYLTVVGSAGSLTGGLITDNGDGTATVTTGSGIIKPSDSDTADSKFLSWSADTNVSLTDNSINYIYIDYNSGSPQVATSTSIPTDHNTKILRGLVYREGTTLHITNAGQIINNYQNKTFWKDLEINGKYCRSTGIIKSEDGTRNFATTSGNIYAGLTKVSFAAFDSSGSDTFTYYYRDGSGGWTAVTGQTQINNTQYDDGSGSLATLNNSGKKYGVHWVYGDPDGDFFDV